MIDPDPSIGLDIEGRYHSFDSTDATYLLVLQQFYADHPAWTGVSPDVSEINLTNSDGGPSPGAATESEVSDKDGRS
jgi:hypothetical protein